MKLPHAGARGCWLTATATSLALCLGASTSLAEEPAPPPAPPVPPSFPERPETLHPVRDEAPLWPAHTSLPPLRTPRFTRGQAVALAATSGVFSLGSFSVNLLPSPRVLGVHNYYDYATALVADAPLLAIEPTDGLAVGGVQVGSLGSTIALRYGKDRDGTVKSYWTAVDNINLHIALWATYATYRDARLQSDPDAWTDRWHPATAGELITAPFRPKNLKHPLVYIPLTIEAGTVTLIGVLNAGSESFAVGPAARDSLLGAAASLSAGMTEEAIFRGVIYEELQQSLGRWPARAIDASAFSLWHVPGELDSESTATIVGGLVTRAGLGILFEAAYDDGGLPESVALHAIWDTTAFLFAAVTHTTAFSVSASPFPGASGTPGPRSPAPVITTIYSSTW